MTYWPLKDFCYLKLYLNIIQVSSDNYIGLIVFDFLLSFHSNYVASFPKCIRADHLEYWLHCKFLCRDKDLLILQHFVDKIV